MIPGVRYEESNSKHTQKHRSEGVGCPSLGARQAKTSVGTCFNAFCWIGSGYWKHRSSFGHRFTVGYQWIIKLSDSSSQQ